MFIELIGEADDEVYYVNLNHCLTFYQVDEDSVGFIFGNHTEPWLAKNSIEDIRSQIKSLKG